MPGGVRDTSEQDMYLYRKVPNHRQQPAEAESSGGARSVAAM